MNNRFRSFVVATIMLAPMVLAAQDMKSPKWITIGREVVKPGKDAAHTKHEAAWARAYEAAKIPAATLAMVAMSGPNEAWWMTGFESAEAIQKYNDAVGATPALAAVSAQYYPPEADYLANTFMMIARYREDLSYSTGSPITALRYMVVSRIGVKLGHSAEFVEARKMIKAAHEKAKAADGYSVYQVTAGAPAGTFLVFAGKKSMADLDVNPHGDAYTAALGGADGEKKLNEMLMSYEGSADSNLFRLSPSMSVLNKQWYDADAFWKPKAAKK